MINAIIPENSRKLAEVFNKYNINSMADRLNYIQVYDTVEKLEKFLESKYGDLL